MMATVPHVTSGLGLRKFQADGFLLTRVYLTPVQVHSARTGGIKSRFGVRGTYHPEESQRAQFGVRYAILQKVLNFCCWGGGSGG